MAIDQYIQRLFEREGYFSNHPNDRGGPTKFGITQTTLSTWRGKPATIEEVRSLTAEEAYLIYRRLYFENHKIGLLPDPIEEQVFDFGVNSGPQLAIRALQECLGTTIDGTIGPDTIQAAEVACRGDKGRSLNLKLAKWRAMMLARICRHDPSQLAFLAGWLRRTLDFIS